jgi:NADH-quinone oxidoreductase subunit F
MDFRQLIATAESVCDFSQDPEVVNIYLSSLANNEATSELYILLKEECNHSGLKVNIFKTGSAGYYDLEPTVLVEKPAGPAVLYCNVNRGKILAIVKDFLKGENPGLDLAFCSFGDKKNDNILRAGELSLFKRQDRIALRNCGCVDPLNVNHYILRSSGYRGLSRCLSMRPDEVIDALRKSGLRGRGGAGFNTAEKWQACREAGGSEKYVVCNAVDSDPQALTARLLLEGDPHSIIEGILIAAYAVGASHCLLVAAEEYREAVARLNTGLRQAREYNLLGTGILGTAFNTEIEIKTVKRTLVAGEETALLQAIEDKQAMPYLRLSYPSASGYKNKPTLVNNIETLANVTAIFNRESLATGSDHGRIGRTKVVTLAGNTAHKYTVEVSLESTISSIVKDIGGGVKGGQDINAVQFGGPTGCFFRGEGLDTPIDFDTMNSIGAIVGSGTIDVFDDSWCAVKMAGECIAYLQTQSCGKCVFCREGTIQIASILVDIEANGGRPNDLEMVIELGEMMKTNTICGLGKAAANPVLSSIRLFREEYDAHIKEKKCLVGKAVINPD